MIGCSVRCEAEALRCWSSIRRRTKWREGDEEEDDEEEEEWCRHGLIANRLFSCRLSGFLHLRLVSSSSSHFSSQMSHLFLPSPLLFLSSSSLYKPFNSAADMNSDVFIIINPELIKVTSQLLLTGWNQIQPEPPAAAPPAGLNRYRGPVSCTAHMRAEPAVLIKSSSFSL